MTLQDKKAFSPNTCHHLHLTQDITLGIRDGDYICETCGKIAPGTTWKYENRPQYKLNISLKISLKPEYRDSSGHLSPKFREGKLEALTFLLSLYVPDSDNALHTSSHFKRTNAQDGVTIVDYSTIICNRPLIYKGVKIDSVRDNIQDEFNQWKKNLSADSFLEAVHKDTILDIKDIEL